MCGGKDKPCCTCYCGDGGCIAAMREDFYHPATAEQIVTRLTNHNYPDGREVMIKFLEEKYGIDSHYKM